MHTIKKTTPEGEVKIHHNSDWSGMAIVVVNGVSCEIPASLLSRNDQEDVDFDEIDSANDHCEWLAEKLDDAGGELVVRYRKMSDETRRQQEHENEKAAKRAQLARLKEELGEK